MGGSNSKPETGVSVSTSESQCPVRRRDGVSSPSAPAEECPVKRYKYPVQYNVKSQVIDPTNQMPSTPHQQPASGQRVALPTVRVESSIPKAGTFEGTWLYPSPQMFWNALVRKNKIDGSREEDMETVVAVHNNMNENTWRQVIAWEALKPLPEDPDQQPKLLRFQGRPDELSPKAYLKTLFGHPKPFDRHDWIVDRGGHLKRYVIDYYSDESLTDKDELPQHLQDIKAMKSIRVDVRPALDSLDAFVDRLLRMPWEQYRGSTLYSPPPFFAPSPMIRAQEQKQIVLQLQWQEIQSKCPNAKEAVKNCKNESECSIASVELQKCIAGVVCPSVLREFEESVLGSPRDMNRIDRSYVKMTDCIDKFELDSRK